MSLSLHFGPRTRALLIVILLALSAAGAGVMVLGRKQSSSGASPGQTTPAAPAKPVKPAKPVTHAPKPAATPRSAAPKPSATPVAPANGLPAAIQQALSANHVVVVALYDPRAKVDDTALREASAGAQLAGTTFVPVDVTKGEVDPLNARYGVIQDPAVLVLRPPGDLIVRIDGFADRDTVAQAAANAAS